MNDWLRAEVLWSAGVILLIPLVVVGTSELQERLRQADSPLLAPVRTVRNWVVPFVALWALLVPVLAVERGTWYVQVVATGLIVSSAIAAWQLLRIVGDGIYERSSAAGARPVPKLVLAFPRLAIVLVAGALVLSSVWGVNLSAALTALGVTSLVVSFALQDTLSGLASGVLLLTDRPFKPGDWISVGDTEGVVVDINWRTSRLRDRNGDMIVVPNSQLANASLVNYSDPDPLHRIVVSLQVAFVNPPSLARDMLLDAARSVPGVLLDPAPDVFVTVIDDPLMGYDCLLWVDDYEIVPRVRSDFSALVWYQSHRHGVPLPSPAQDIFVHDAAAEAKAAEPTLQQVRSALAVSPLLERLPDDDLDRVANRARLVRYRAGELLFDSASEERDVLVVTQGSGRLVLLEPGMDEALVGEVGVGDLVWLLDARRGDDRVVAMRAVTDCEAVVVPDDVIGEVAGRNAEIVAAFNRLVAMRQRRVNRLVERQALARLARDSPMDQP